MKKVFLLVLLCYLLLHPCAYTQNLIAVQSGSATAFYMQVDDAILNSQDGDTIYIPGGTWNLTQPINKRLYLIGIGHHPDSSVATFPTRLIGNFSLVAGASNGSLTGIYLDGAILGTSDTVSNYTICRCFISWQGITLSPSNLFFTFIENTITGSCVGYGVSQCSFFNNIFSGWFIKTSINTLIPWNYCIFKNNIFLYSSQCYPGLGCWINLGSQYSLLENNVFYGYTYGLTYVLNSTFNNNLFIDSFGSGMGTNVGLNNIVSQLQNSIFVNQNGNDFSYAHDYHLQSTCPGKNAGTDGTDIGIYGGLYPWKDGSVPFNPHIQLKNIPSNTDSNGNLNVNIKVSAQDH